MLNIFTSNDMSLSFDERDGSLFLSTVGAEYKTEKSDYRIRKEGSVFRVEGRDAAFTLAINGLERLGCPTIKLTLSDIVSSAKSFAFPPAFIPAGNELHVNPYCEGVIFDPHEEFLPIPEYQSFATAGQSSMSFWGMLRGEEWFICSVITASDAALCHSREAQCWVSYLNWLPSLGKFEGERVMEITRGSGGITKMCKVYREIVREKGYYRSFAEKSKVKNTERFIGSADVWLWNDDAMDKLYSASAVYHPPTEEQNALRREIATDMKNSGMNHILWSVFDENIDKPTLDYIKSLGYMTTFYDIYSDVIPKPVEEIIPATRRKRCEQRIPWWPDGIGIDADGNYIEAWQLRGIDGKFYSQNRMCDIAAYECAKQIIPEHTAKTGLDARFIDVVMMSAPECYSEKHPASRSTAIEYKKKLFSIMEELGILCGTENGREDCVPECEYNEGMLSILKLRVDNAGRRMTDIHGGETAAFLKSKMLNPKYRVPLFELVFHDCMTSYWYWGDSTLGCPELTPLRDAYCRLYGLPPIYSFRASDWEKLKPMMLESYNRTVPFATEVGSQEMVSFEWLTPDRMVQRTTFSSGASVTVDFREYFEK